MLFYQANSYAPIDYKYRPLIIVNILLKYTAAQKHFIFGLVPRLRAILSY
uniref:Uncharacterized protein n=1 Tax=Arundo donax TaxID=35708 RepID=A0A0A9HQY4_ARUDO